MADRTCSIDGCERRHCARTWCHKHYQKWKRHGDPLGGTDHEPRVGTCAVDTCDRPVSGKGLCFKHYARKRNTGNATGLKVPPNRHGVSSDGHGELVITRKNGDELVVLYDLEDHERIAARRWRINSDGYAVSSCRTIDVWPNGTNMPLHAYLLNLARGHVEQVDHINGIRTDNRRSNLRLVSHRANIAHQAVVNKRGTSRFRNVHVKRNRWVVQITIHGRQHFVGSFVTEEAAAAAAARFRAAQELPSGY